MHAFNFFLKIDSAVDFLFLVPKKGYVSDFEFSLSLSFSGSFQSGFTSVSCVFAFQSSFRLRRKPVFGSRKRRAGRSSLMILAQLHLSLPLLLILASSLDYVEYLPKVLNEWNFSEIDTLQNKIWEEKKVHKMWEISWKTYHFRVTSS